MLFPVDICSYRKMPGCMYWKTRLLPAPSPPPGEISADVIWGGKYDEDERETVKSIKEKWKK
jgi:hypothetical protein